MALDFDGATENVSWGSDASLDDIVQKTVSAWINIDTYGEASFGRIFSKEGAGATVGWSFQVSNSLGNLATIAMTDQRATTDGVWKAPTNAILLNTWYHVAFTYDNSSVANDPVFYVNGALVATTEEAPPVGAHSPDAAVSLFMGDRQDLDRNFDGRIADARIYNRLLTAAEIETINACRGRDGIFNGLVLRALLGDKGEGVVAAAGDPKDLTGVNASTQVGAPPYAADTLNRGGAGGST